MSPKKNNTKSTHHGQKLKKKRRRSKSKIKNKTKYTATEHKFLTKNIHGEVDTKKLICKYKQKFTRSKRTDGALYQQITKMKKKMQAVVDQMEAVDDKISEVDHWNANEQYLFEDGIDHNLNYHNTNHSYSSPSPVLHRAPSPIFMPYIEENRNSLSLQQIPPIAPIPFMTQTPAPAPFLAPLPVIPPPPPLPAAPIFRFHQSYHINCRHLYHHLYQHLHHSWHLQHAHRSIHLHYLLFHHHRHYLQHPHRSIHLHYLLFHHRHYLQHPHRSIHLHYLLFHHHRHYLQHPHRSIHLHYLLFHH
eukprot:730403_1